MCVYESAIYEMQRGGCQAAKPLSLFRARLEDVPGPHAGVSRRPTCLDSGRRSEELAGSD